MARKDVGVAPTLDPQIVTKGYVENWVKSRGTDLVTNGTGLLGNNTNFSGFTFNPADSPIGGGSFVCPQLYPLGVFTDDLIPVDGLKQYQFAWQSRQVKPGGLGAQYGAVSPYDVDKLGVVPQMYMFQANTTTTLAATLNPGDTTVALTSAANWNNAAGGSVQLRTIIFWDYVDGKGKAWGERTYSRNYLLYAYLDGAINFSTNVITLTVPWAGPVHLVGTKVSNGSAGGTYMYTGAVNTLVPETWTQFAGVIGGLMPSGTAITSQTSATNKFPPGTAYAKIGWLLNYSVANGTSQQAVAAVSFSDAGAAYAGLATKAAIAGQAFTGAISAPNLSGTNTGDSAPAAAIDARATNTTPDDYNGALSKMMLKTNSIIGLPNGEGFYSAVHGFRNFSNSTGGAAHEYAYTSSGNTYHRWGLTTTWSAWIKVADTAAANVFTDDARLSDARTPLAHTQTASTITDFATAADARVVAGITAKANIDSPTFTGTVGGITKAMVGLASVDNTTDVAKPVSTAQAAADATKAAIAGQVFTGAISAPNLSGTNTGDQSAITGNAGSATKLLTPRAINGVDFDGTADITIPVGAHTQLASTITDLGIAPSSVMHFATYGDRSLAIDGASGTRRGMISYCDDVGFLQTVYTDYGAWYALVPDPDPATTTGRLSPGGMNNLVTDWDDALATGWYAGAGAAHAPPFGGWYMGTVEALSVGGATWVTQTLQPFSAGESASDTMMYRRERVGGSWGLWYKLRWSQDEQDAKPSLATLMATPASTSTGALTDVTGLSVGFTPAANRIVRVLWGGQVTSTVGNDRAAVFLREGTTVLVSGVVQIPVANVSYLFNLNLFLTNPPAAFHTYKTSFYRQAGSGVISFPTQSTAPMQLFVEDCGSSL